MVPLRLEARLPGQPSVPILSLDATGHIDVTVLSSAPLAARLDERGCLVGADGLWAELTPAGELWTPHEVLVTDGSAIRLPAGAALQILPDGTVQRVERDGPIEPQAHGALKLEGYRGDARCAGLLMLATFLAMMPSMAVVDGHPAMAPAPDGSLCNDFRHPSPEGDQGAR